MRVLYIVLIFILTYPVAAQQENSTTTDKIQNEKIENTDQNVIDFKNPTQKVKPVKVINHERAVLEQNRKLGLAKTSGPAEILEKKQNVDSQLTNKQLKEHLKPIKVMRPMR